MKVEHRMYRLQSKGISSYVCSVLNTPCAQISHYDLELHMDNMLLHPTRSLGVTLSKILVTNEVE